MRRGGGENEMQNLKKGTELVECDSFLIKRLQCHITIKINPAAITCGLIPLRHL